MHFCQEPECSGLDACPACTGVRRTILMAAVSAANLSREQAEIFFRAYGEAFEEALKKAREAVEEARLARLAEKEQRAKQAPLIEESVRAAGARLKKSNGTKNGTHKTVSPQETTPAATLEKQKEE